MCHSLSFKSGFTRITSLRTEFKFPIMSSAKLKVVEKYVRSCIWEDAQGVNERMSGDDEAGDAHHFCGITETKGEGEGLQI